MKSIEYDAEVFKELNEKLDEIMEFCIRNHIPIFTTYAKEKNGTTEYINNVVTPINADVHLSNDRITKYNASLNENLVLKFKKSAPETYAGDVFDSFMDE